MSASQTHCPDAVLPAAAEAESRMAVPFSGGCACGAIRYEAYAEPIAMLHCHCRDCQRTGGGPFLSIAAVPKEAVEITRGSPTYHATQSDAGGSTRRGFCPRCGSPVLIVPESAPHLVGITPGSLDDPGWFRPQMNVWTTDACAWARLDPELPRFTKYPQ